MKILIQHKDKEELEEFYNTSIPEPIKKNGIELLSIHLDDIDTEWYVPLCNVLWWEIDYENEGKGV